MATNNAVTSSAALTELKSDLTRLSNTLHVIYDLMNTDMSQVGQAWQDGKYQEFVDGFKPQIQKCEDISARYSEWCARVLDPTIENVIAVEKTDVGGGGTSVGVGSSVGAGAGVSGAAAMGASSSLASKFNNGSVQTATREPRKPSGDNDSTWVERNVINPIFGTKEEREINRIKKEGPKTADEACKIDFPDSHAVPKDPNDPSARKLHVSTSSSSGEWNANVKVGYETPPTPYGTGSADVGGGYTSGKDSVTIDRDIYYDCVPDK